MPRLLSPEYCSQLRQPGHILARVLDQADLSANREAYEARAKGEDGRVKATKARGFTFFGVVTSAQKEHKKAERRKAAAVKKFMSLDKVRVEGNFFGKGARGGRRISSPGAPCAAPLLSHLCAAIAALTAAPSPQDGSGTIDMREITDGAEALGMTVTKAVEWFNELKEPGAKDVSPPP